MMVLQEKLKPCRKEVTIIHHSEGEPSWVELDWCTDIASMKLVSLMTMVYCIHYIWIITQSMIIPEPLFASQLTNACRVGREREVASSIHTYLKYNALHCWELYSSSGSKSTGHVFFMENARKWPLLVGWDSFVLWMKTLLKETHYANGIAFNPNSWFKHLRVPRGNAYQGSNSPLMQNQWGSL